MKQDHRYPSDSLERITRQIRETPDSEKMHEASARVWARLSEEATAEAASGQTTLIGGCSDFQAMIPHYLDGSLAEARAALLKNHTRACLDCRKALAKKPAGAEPVLQASRRFNWQPSSAILAMAAVLILVFGALFYAKRSPGKHASLQGQATVLQGAVFGLSGQGEPVFSGQTLAFEQPTRTRSENGAVLETVGDARIEIRKRSNFSLAHKPGATTFRLDRGGVIVRDAASKGDALYVATPECLISSNNAVFTVNHGVKGTRVSVLRGDVRVDRNGTEVQLSGGNQFSSRRTTSEVPMALELAWSTELDTYLALMEEHGPTRAKQEATALRTSPALLDALPASSLAYTAIALSGTAETSLALNPASLLENPAWDEWFLKTYTGPLLEDYRAALASFQGIEAYLAGDLVLAAQEGQSSLYGGVVALAERNGSAIDEELLQQHLTTLGQVAQVIVVEDPFSLTQQSADNQIYFWIGESYVVSATQPSVLSEVAGFLLHPETNPFVQSPFYQRVVDLYETGVHDVMAVDLEKVVAHQSQTDNQLQELGFANAESLMLRQHTVHEQTYGEAVFSFNGQLHGLPSWLAEPGPMGSLEFVSPDAAMVSALTMKEPAQILDDLMAILPGVDGEESTDPNDPENVIGLKFRDDFASALGGEVAVVFEPPFFPTPAWKLILEVYDYSGVQVGMEAMVAAINGNASEPMFVLEEEVAGDQVYYSLRSASTGIGFVYAFVDGYMIATPSWALLDRTIRYKESGYNMADMEQLTALLPADGQPDFSALFYENLAPTAESLVKLFPDAASRPEVLTALAQAKAKLTYAYAEQDRITFASASGNDPLGFGITRLLGGGPLGLGLIKGSK